MKHDKNEINNEEKRIEPGVLWLKGEILKAIKLEFKRSPVLLTINILTLIAVLDLRFSISNAMSAMGF